MSLQPLLALSDDIARIAFQSYEYNNVSSNSYNQTRIRPRKPQSDTDVWDELRWNNGPLGGVPPVSFSIKHRPRGEFISRAIGASAGLCFGLLAPFSLAAPLRFGIPMLGITGSKVASLLMIAYPAMGLANYTTRAVRFMANYATRIRRIEMGGNYDDSATATALRFAAVRDMSSAHGTARSYLGREALYLSR